MGEAIPEGWWEAAFHRTRNHSEIRGHPRGNSTMVIIVAYDIVHPRRLKRVADCCKDYGFRVQYSVFECHLEAPRFEEFWTKLNQLIDKREDRIVAYPVPGDAQRKIRSTGTFVLTDRPVSYIF